MDDSFTAQFNRYFFLNLRNGISIKWKLKQATGVKSKKHINAHGKARQKSEISISWVFTKSAKTKTQKNAIDTWSRTNFQYEQ